MEDKDRLNIRNKSRYQNILDAAATIFREKGYHHANISDIAKMVGIKKGSLYYYIKSKDQLLYDIVVSAVNLYSESIEKISAPHKRPDTVLREGILAHMKPIDVQFDRCYIFANERHNLSADYKKDIETRTRRYEKQWIEIVELGKKKGIFRADLDSKMTVFAIFGMCRGLLWWYKAGGKFNIKELSEMYAQTILNGIKKKK